MQALVVPLIPGVDAAGGDLARHLDHRHRTLRSQIERRQLGGRACRDHLGAGHVAQRALAIGRQAGGAPPGDDPTLDHEGALRLDQLLGDGPQQRLPGPGRAPGAEPRDLADRRAEEDVVAERLVEGRVVVVEADRVAGALDRLVQMRRLSPQRLTLPGAPSRRRQRAPSARRRPLARAAGERRVLDGLAAGLEPGLLGRHRRDPDDALRRALPGADEDRPALDVEEALVDAVADPGDVVGAATAGQAVGPRGCYVDDEAVADRPRSPCHQRSRT